MSIPSRVKKAEREINNIALDKNGGKVDSQFYVFHWADVKIPDDELEKLKAKYDGKPGFHFEWYDSKSHENDNKAGDT